MSTESRRVRGGRALIVLTEAVVLAAVLMLLAAYFGWWQVPDAGGTVSHMRF